MLAPKALNEDERQAMNEAARDYAWTYYNKGLMLAVEALRAGIENGYRPTHAELVILCNTLEQKTREPRSLDCSECGKSLIPSGDGSDRYNCACPENRN